MILFCTLVALCPAVLLHASLSLWLWAAAALKITQMRHKGIFYVTKDVATVCHVKACLATSKRPPSAGPVFLFLLPLPAPCWTLCAQRRLMKFSTDSYSHLGASTHECSLWVLRVAAGIAHISMRMTSNSNPKSHICFALVCVCLCGELNMQKYWNRNEQTTEWVLQWDELEKHLQYFNYKGNIKEMSTNLVCKVHTLLKSSLLQEL